MAGLISAPGSRYCSSVDPDRARQLLERERERIERAIADLGRDPADDRDEPGEAGSEDLYQKEFDEGRAEARLAAGTYGLSVESGMPIPDERLESLPTAERTVQEAQADGRA